MLTLCSHVLWANMAMKRLRFAKNKSIMQFIGNYKIMSSSFRKVILYYQLL